MFGQSVLERVAAQRRAGAGREERVGRLAFALAQPCPQDRDGRCGQWRDALLASFAQTVDVGAVSEVQIGQSKSDQLGGTKPGLGGEQEQSVVAAAGPGRFL